jgi:hypothetical protein
MPSMLRHRASNSCFSLRDAGLGPRNVANIASANWRWDTVLANQMPTDCGGGVLLREEQGIIVAGMHGGDAGEGLLDILRDKMTGSRAIVFEAIMPCLASIIVTDIAFEPTISTLVSGDRMICSGSVLKCSR